MSETRNEKLWNEALDVLRDGRVTGIAFGETEAEERYGEALDLRLEGVRGFVQLAAFADENGDPFLTATYFPNGEWIVDDAGREKARWRWLERQEEKAEGELREINEFLESMSDDALGEAVRALRVSAETIGVLAAALAERSEDADMWAKLNSHIVKGASACATGDTDPGPIGTEDGS